MDRDDGLCTLEVHYGGTFKSDHQYFGGHKVDVYEDYDTCCLTFEELERCMKSNGYHSVLKSAFRDPNEVEKYHFFHDEHSLCDKFNLHHSETTFVKVYLECLFADLTEDVSVGKDIEINLTYHSDVGKGKEIEMEIDELENVESDLSDGLEDEDFSSDDEFRELRQKRRNDKVQKTIVVERVNLLQQGEEVEQEEIGVIHSEYEDSDTSQASMSSNEEADFIVYKKTRKSMNYDINCDHTKLKFEIGMRFKDCGECKEAVRLWAIVNGHNIKWKKSGGSKLQAVCEDGCPWKFYASKLAGEPTCVIKTYVGEHKCLRAVQNRQVTSTWLAKVIVPVMKRNLRYPTKDMIKDVKLTYDATINEDMCFRARHKALVMLRGTYESHYSKLRSYISALKTMDKAGRFDLKTYLDKKDKPIFQRVYIGFSALKDGFRVGCRKAIGFDACFLKTILGGVILAGVAKDCNNKMFPIAWAVVEKENEETWSWFFEILFQELDIHDGFGWTFMSDKHKGLINGIQKLAPNAEHRHCARHVYANWKKTFSGPKYKILFWKAVKCTSKTKFRIATSELKQESVLAYEGFFSRQPKAFCKSLVQIHTKTDIVDNNICETFNSYILKFRDKPIITMLEDIRLSLMSRMHDIYKCLQSSVDILCPNIRKKLERIQGMVKLCTVIPDVGLLYEVHMIDGDIYIVNLDGRECNCRWWMLTGIPCVHALACIIHTRHDLETYVDVFYHKSNCLEAYKHALTPLNDPREWPVVNEPLILPPKIVRQAGRPRKNRRRDPYEELKKSQKTWPKKGIKMSCHKCGSFGHNVRTCKAEGPLEEPPKAKKRRANKSGETSQQMPPFGETSHQIPPFEKTSQQMQKTRQNERRLTRQGFGVRTFTESGNVYIRPPGARRVNLIYQPEAIAKSCSNSNEKAKVSSG